MKTNLRTITEKELLNHQLKIVKTETAYTYEGLETFDLIKFIQTEETLKVPLKMLNMYAHIKVLDFVSY